MKVMLIGAGGQLASDLRKALERETIIPLAHADLDITDAAAIRRAFESHRPQVVVNTAAFHRVDDCESQVEKAFRVNSFAVRDLALACLEWDATLVHFSTDFVFGGDKSDPYIETDRPQPLNVYGASKLAGEYLVSATLGKCFLIRTCGLYGLGGSKSKGANFVETILRKAAEGKPLRVVSDQVITPTYTVDLARKVAELIRSDGYGLYHISNNGSCSWFEFARRALELSGVKADLSPTTSKAYGAPTRRAPYSVLRNYRLECLGLDDLPVWEDALVRYLAERNRQGGNDCTPAPLP